MLQGDGFREDRVPGAREQVWVASQPLGRARKAFGQARQAFDRARGNVGRTGLRFALTRRRGGVPILLVGEGFSVPPRPE